ncbi:MAG: hypothetical protein RML15_07405 [Bacteroidota bacterium]|nr:hypothetical protein [Candidatus Kapabacteria bacterium]MCX7936705.1 hypothetical protein [Chlorobiota bacterium]MDW8272219.1 hypothetical protein [Bacteroidota bacterium]
MSAALLFSLLSIASALTIWSGCATPYQLPHMVSDSINVQITGDNVVIQTNAPPKYRLVFRQPGDSYTIPRNEPFELVYDNADIANTMLVITGTEGQNSITLTLQDKFNPVRLTSKCQFVDLLGIDKIPPIEVQGNDMLKQQVIITPIISEDCKSITGYEVRYGSIQQGCTTTAQRVELLNKCRGGRTTTTTRNVYSILTLRKLLFNL